MVAKVILQLFDFLLIIADLILKKKGNILKLK